VKNRAMNSASVDEDLLAQVTSAFSRHDLDAIAALFAEDGQFVNALGASAFGDRYSGRREIRDYFAGLFANSPNLAYRPLEPNWICGNKVVLQWHRTATTRAGEVQDWIGCDLLTFEGRLVARCGSSPALAH
jgi:uncharacterized protein (TIGR02246 family)